MTIDAAKARLDGISTGLEAALDRKGSEQDARLQIINRMLIEVCGWRHDQIKTEVANERGFADYSLIDGKGRTVCVVEAKKTGRLIIDSASVKKTAAQVGGSVLKKAKDGIDQAVGYCVETSCGYAVVTDGQAWIFFRLRSDGVPFREGKAIVFPNFAAVGEDFATFFELLAPASLDERLHFARINQAEGFQHRVTEPRYYVKAPDEAKLQIRNDFSRDISEIFNRFFSGMASETDAEMRKTCFVETGESRAADATLGKIASHLVNSIQVLESESSEALRDEIAGVVASKQSEICLIVGNKGAGKSTFVKRFFEDVLPDDLKNSCVTAVVDLADFTGDESALQRWLSEELRDKLEDAIFSERKATYEDYMGMFFRTYKRWSEATYRDLYATNKTEFKIKFGEYVEKRRDDAPDDYAIGLMRHTAVSRVKLPCVIFDNTDQHLSKIQEAVFQYAVSLRNGCVCFLLVPITDRSIWRLSKSGAFQSYSSRTFFLPVPPAKEILAKRISFIESKLSGDPAISGSYFSSKGIRISISNLNAFVQVLEEAFVKDEHLSGLIGRLSNFDIRRMLILAQRTICSPAFRVDDLIRVYVDKKNRGFDPKRAMRAMILGDYDRHVDRSSEFVMNVFLTEGNRPHSPILVLAILEVLAGIKNQAGTDPATGYATISSLIDYFEPCRVEPDDVRSATKSLLIRRLVEPLEPDSEDYSDGAKVGITFAGEAHQELAYGDRVYAEQMAMTTGLRLEAVKAQLSNYAGDLGDRQARDALLRTFLDYVLEEDNRKMQLPAAANYASQRKLRSELHGRRL
jgi:hypothetical protein